MAAGAGCACGRRRRGGGASGSTAIASSSAASTSRLSSGAGPTRPPRGGPRRGPRGRPSAPCGGGRAGATQSAHVARPRSGRCRRRPPRRAGRSATSVSRSSRRRPELVVAVADRRVALDRDLERPRARAGRASRTEARGGGREAGRRSSGGRPSEGWLTAASLARGLEGSPARDAVDGRDDDNLPPRPGEPTARRATTASRPTRSGARPNEARPAAAATATAGRAASAPGGAARYGRARRSPWPLGGILPSSSWAACSRSPPGSRRRRPGGCVGLADRRASVRSGTAPSPRSSSAVRGRRRAARDLAVRALRGRRPRIRSPTSPRSRACGLRSRSAAAASPRRRSSLMRRPIGPGRRPGLAPASGCGAARPTSGRSSAVVDDWWGGRRIRHLAARGCGSSTSAARRSWPRPPRRARSAS